MGRAARLTTAGRCGAHRERDPPIRRSLCGQEMGSRTLWPHVGTVSTSPSDLDAIRAALGDDKPTYLGYSRTAPGSAPRMPRNSAAGAGNDSDGAVDPNADPIGGASCARPRASRTRSTTMPPDRAKNAGCPGADPAKAVPSFQWQPGRSRWSTRTNLRTAGRRARRIQRAEL